MVMREQSNEISADGPSISILNEFNQSCSPFKHRFQIIVYSFMYEGWNGGLGGEREREGVGGDLTFKDFDPQNR